MASTTFTDTVTLIVSAWLNDVDTATYSALTSVSGTNTITATGPLNLALASGILLRFIPQNTNSGAATLNVSGLGAKSIFLGGLALVGNELVANAPVLVYYDGTQFNLVGGPAMRQGATATTFTFNGSGGTSSSVTVMWQRVGNWVTLNIPAATATTGTGSTTFTSDTAIAAAARPTSTQVGPIMTIRNNGADVGPAGTFVIGAGGNIVIERDAAATAFTNTASAGLSSSTTIVYYAG